MKLIDAKLEKIWPKTKNTKQTILQYYVTTILCDRKYNKPNYRPKLPNHKMNI